eukprot:gene32611-40244_t
MESKAVLRLCMICLFSRFKQEIVVVVKLLPLIPEYGYFKDYFRIIESVTPGFSQECLTDTIVGIVAAQLLIDEATLKKYLAERQQAATSSDSQQSVFDIVNKNDKGEIIYTPNKDTPYIERVSNLAKWAPRSHSYYAQGCMLNSFHKIQHTMFPQEAYHTGQSLKYKQLVTSISRVLDLPEIKMCSGRFSQIDFKRVPSLCVKLHRKAFLNETYGERMPDTDEADLNGNRHPDIPDRVQCRANLQQALFDGKVHGKMLKPHEITAQLMDRSSRRSRLEKVLIQSQWDDIKASVLEKMAQQELRKAERNAEQQSDSGVAPGVAKKVSTTLKEAVNLGKMVPLVDVSASMAGEPIKINHPAFRDRVITFETNPRWCDLSDCDGQIVKKVPKLQAAPWHGSTNIEKAFKLILDVVVANKLPVEEVPDLIIFSDMQFDEASGAGSHGRQTMLDSIKNMFHDAGVKICGTPYPAPRIVFWNLRGDTKGFPAKSDDSNVQLLSGFSPSLLKHIME